MKRPSLALLALLASLACGLVAMTPRRADAMTCGELLCAIEVISPPCHAAHDDFCPACPYAKELAEECPHVCTPPGAPCPLETNDVAPVEEPVTEATDATAQVELNAADVSAEADNESAWEDEYGYYYGDFKTDEEYASEYASEYEAAVEDAVAETPEPTVVEEAAPASPDYADIYGANYDPWTVVSEPLSVPSPDDLVVEAGDAVESETLSEERAEAAPVVDPYDLYGRQVGDEFYGHDYDAVTPEESAYDSAYEYEYEYEAPVVEEKTPVTEPEEAAADATNEANADSYYEEYYPDYYAELYSREQSENVEAAETAETPADSDDLATEYDSAYDNAVYGEAAQSTEASPAPGTVIEVPNDEIIDELVDPTTAESESDLPWADEAPAEAAAEAEVETAERPALESEYGSDYAEDYYRALFGEEVEESTDELNEEEFDAEPLYDETYELFMPPCRESECLHPAIDATQIVVDYGRTVFELTDVLELASMRLHSAAVMLAEMPSHVEVK
jgi:hypothetical protein